MSPSPPPPVSIPREKPSSSSAQKTVVSFTSDKKDDDDDDDDYKSSNNNERKKKKTKKKKRNKTGKEKKLKEKFIALIRRKLIENAQFRRNFVKANEYNKVAQSIRVCFREEDKDKEDNNKEEREKMLCFLDSKSHFLFVVDKVLFVEKSEEKKNTTTTNDQEKNENEKHHRKEEVKEEEENKYRNHVNLMEPSESWLRVKNYHRNKFEKLGENAALAIKEKQKAKREAKERVNKARMEKKEKETREKERKERKRKYHVDLEYYRYKGTCLDWVNTGMCRFGSECTYTHDETAKGKLIEAAREVEAKTGRDRGLRGEYASAKEESGKKNTRKRGEEKDRKEGEEEEENEGTKGERKRRKREDVLLGDFDDDFDDDKDNTVVPGFLKAKMKQQKEDKEGRPALSIRERKLLKKKREEEEIKAREASNNNKKKKKFDKTKRVLSRKASTDKKVKTIGGGSGMTKKKKKERHPDGRHAKRSKARLEQIQ